MSEKRKRPGKKSRNSKYKIILVAVLSVVLAGVVFTQFGGSSENSNSSTRKDSHAGRRNTGSSGDSAKQELRKRELRSTVTEQRSQENQPTLTKVTHTSVVARKQAEEPGTKPGKIPAKKWPATTLAEATKADPFGLPTEFVQTVKREQEEKAEARRLALAQEQAALAEEERRKTLDAVATLQSKGVEMIFVSDKQRVAKIDGEFYRVGDMIGNLRVTKIERDGTVTVEVAKSIIDINSVDAEQSK